MVDDPKGPGKRANQARIMEETPTRLDYDLSFFQSIQLLPSCESMNFDNFSNSQVACKVKPEKWKVPIVVNSAALKENGGWKTPGNVDL